MKKLIGKLIILLIILATLFGVVMVNREKIAVWLFPKIVDVEPVINSDPEPTITIDYISKELKNISKLQTAEITYGCIVDFKDGEIPIINKKQFSMYYEATVQAGIDMGKITCIEENGKFIIQLPAVQIDKVSIDPNSLEFLDVDKAIFNKFQPNDTQTALQRANEDVYNQATTDQLLDIAEKNAIDVVTSFFSAFNKDIEFYVKTTPRTKTERIKLSVSSDDIKGVDYLDLKYKFEKAGFTNVSCVAVEDLTFLNENKEGQTESVTVNGKSTFKSNNVFEADTEIVITYHTKKK